MERVIHTNEMRPANTAQTFLHDDQVFLQVSCRILVLHTSPALPWAPAFPLLPLPGDPLLCSLEGVPISPFPQGYQA